MVCRNLVIATGDRRCHRLTSKYLLAIRGRWDVQLVAILGHGTAGDVDSLVIEDLHDLRIRQGLSRILSPNKALDSLFYPKRRNVFTGLGVHPAVERVLPQAQPHPPAQVSVS